MEKYLTGKNVFCSNKMEEKIWKKEYLKSYNGLSSHQLKADTACLAKLAEYVSWRLKKTDLI